MDEYSPVKKLSISDEITVQILRLILRGTLSPGERLPPERELAVRFNTNRNTLREAIRNLQTLNVVEARQGDGLKVRDYREVGELNLLPHFLRETKDLDSLVLVLEDMLRVRRLLLTDVCELIAERASAEQIEEIRGLVDRQREQLDEPENLVQTDLEISQAMVRASASLASRWLFNTIVKIYQDIVFQFPDLWVFAPDYIDSMAAVVEEASCGRGAEARKIMQAHLEGSDEMILSAVRSFRDMLD